MAESNTKKMSLADSLGAVLESGDGADVTLVVGGSELPAHSQILAARSPVFAATLRHDMREARSCRIEIADVREAVLKQLLQFIYTDTAPQLDSMADELLSVSDMYDLPVLKERCEEAMAWDLTVDNAATTAVLAELHSCPLLKSAAVEFIAGHLQVMSTEGWKNALLPNVKVAAEICRSVAVARSSPSSQIRVLSNDGNEKLAERLMRAAEAGKVQDVRKLLAAGAPVDAKDSNGDTALHLAVRNKRDAVVRCLVFYAGADVNVKNAKRWTPLHYAQELYYRAGLNMLLVVGADKFYWNCYDEEDLPEIFQIL